MVLLTKKKKKGAVPVYLNVYDLTPMNGYAYWLGLGVYHSGVQGDVFYFFYLEFFLISFLNVGFYFFHFFNLFEEFGPVCELRK
jgi:hypothetical protein